VRQGTGQERGQRDAAVTVPTPVQADFQCADLAAGGPRTVGAYRPQRDVAAELGDAFVGGIIECVSALDLRRAGWVRVLLSFDVIRAVCLRAGERSGGRRDLSGGCRRRAIIVVSRSAIFAAAGLSRCSRRRRSRLVEQDEWCRRTMRVLKVPPLAVKQDGV